AARPRPPARAIVERVQPSAAPVIPVDLDAAHALGVTDPGGTVHLQGETGRVLDLASVSKPLAALGVLVAVERGLVDLDEPAGPGGATVRHLRSEERRGGKRRGRGRGR